jgi:enoyl-CoA hydratase/carnithine racemase
MSGQVKRHVQQRGQGVVVTLAIDNPARLNSLNADLMDAFVEEVRALGDMNDLRVVIITGAGEKSFVGGADITEMGALTDEMSARAFITRVHECCDAVRALPVPTIARINGFTFGAGLELAASCDVRLSSDTSVFGMPEVKLGIPSVVEAALLPMLVGWGRTRWMLLLGESFDASMALEWGFVEKVVPAERLDDAVELWVEAVLSCAPRAVRLQKELIRAWEDLPLRAAVSAGVDAFGSAFRTTEPQEAMRGFLEANARRKAKSASPP